MKKDLTEILGIQYPIIMAPMFLVSNVEMVIAATKSGITGAIPALNYRTDEELRKALREMKKECTGPFGINLIVNKSNPKYKRQLFTCLEEGVDYFITSLGNPKETIVEAHKNGAKVFCDVVNSEYAKKVEDLGCDALIAVNKEAGGHAGKLSAHELLSNLIEHTDLPVISAGGIGTYKGLQEVMGLGAAGASIGSVFIATHEAPVSEEYKQAIVDYSDKDIVMTTKLSGTPCTVINTPYVQKIGTEQNALESLLNKNKKLKKWMKTFTFLKGMKSLQNAAFSTTYKTVWCAGPSIKHVDEIVSVQERVNQLTSPS
jgi:nitronate monooxygenase